MVPSRKVSMRPVKIYGSMNALTSEDEGGNWSQFMGFFVVGLIGVAVLIYLVYALFHPEKF